MNRTKEDMLQKMIMLNKENNINLDIKKIAVSLFKNATKTGNKMFLDAPVTLLKVDRQMYQRPLQRHVKIIAKEWNDDKCDPLMVNYRDNGYFYVIDGQHRLEAALIRGIESLVCNIFIGLSIKEEADMFTEQNEGTKKLSPYDTYKANLCRGEEIDTQIQEVCNEFGIRVEKANVTKTLKSVTAARTIIKTGSKENLAWIFNLFEKSGWNNYKETYASDILLSINNMIINYNSNLHYAGNKLLEFFKTSSPKEIAALGNSEYPQYGRVTRISKILDEIIQEPEGGDNKIKSRITKIA